MRSKLGISGAFHYAKLTGQRSVGIPEENGTTFSDQIAPPNQIIGCCHFKLFYRIPWLGQRTGLSWKENGRVDLKIDTRSLQRSPKEMKYMQKRIVGTKREERGTGIILHAKAQKNENRTAQRTIIYIYYYYFISLLRDLWNQKALCNRFPLIKKVR